MSPFRPLGFDQNQLLPWLRRQLGDAWAEEIVLPIDLDEPTAQAVIDEAKRSFPEAMVFCDGSRRRR